jgi:hypothetical protein
MVHHLLELIMGCPYVILVSGVDYVDDAILILEVVLPETPDGELAADVPDHHLLALDVDLLHVKAVGGGCLHQLVEFHLVEDCGFAGVVDPRHQNTHFVFALGAQSTH